MEDDLDWTAEGAPRSRRYDDVYFSKTDGLAESRAVFLAGCGLPQAWSGRRAFTIGELGFGTGLNVLAALALWAETRLPGGRLRIWSVEAHPLARNDAARALAVWPELASLAAPLLARWPTARGWTRVDWPELGATLDVAIGEAAEELARWDGAADAWFLDGFSPAKNPEMWRDAVLALVAARSTPGARLATFTVAGGVRRGLETHGFIVERKPGHAGKRQRLETYRPGGVEAQRPDATRVVVLGAGIAAASLAGALRAEGLETTIVAGPDAGASGGPAALVTPRLDRGDSASARLSAQAFRRAVDLYEAEARTAVLTRGVRRLGDPAVLAGQGGAAWHEIGTLTMDGDDLWMRVALVVEPATVTAAWLAGAERRVAKVAAIRPGSEGGWRLLDGADELIVEAQTLVVAAGWGAQRLLPSLGLSAVRGQVTVARGLSGEATTWGGYQAPCPEGLMFGATHDRGDEDVEVRLADRTRNLAALQARLPAQAKAAESVALSDWAAIRATKPDHLPMVGEIAPGLWVLTGLGGRGFTMGPLLGEHLAARLAGTPSPLPLDLAAAVDPARRGARVVPPTPEASS